ncbi:MAG TPA: hypothetical protein VGG36_09170 [Rhizomicrobium sp.]|jgi:hypothetical protein
MKHATQAALDRLEPLLREVRKRTALKENSRGAFYHRSRALLHFHEHGDGFFADLKTNHDFERFPATTQKDWKALLKKLDRVLADGIPVR